MPTKTALAAARRAAFLAALVACLAGPASASATGRGVDVQCRLYEHVVNIYIAAGGESEIHRTAAGTIRVNGQLCGGLGLAPADVWNTKQIRITGDDGSEKVTIDLANGGFAPGYGDEAGGTDEIEFLVLMGQGWDQLHVQGSAGPDLIAFGSQPGNWLGTPAINLNAADGDLDVRYLSAEFVLAWGNGGDDTIIANDPDTGIAFLRVLITGGEGDDTLTGGDAGDTLWGDAGDDILKGGKGDDTLYTKDGVNGNDSVNGGSGSDSCTVDPQDVQAGCD